MANKIRKLTVAGAELVTRLRRFYGADAKAAVLRERQHIDVDLLTETRYFLPSIESLLAEMAEMRERAHTIDERLRQLER